MTEGLAGFERRAPDASPVPERYVARFDDPDRPTELTIFDEAAEGLEVLETWVSASWWIELEDAR